MSIFDKNKCDYGTDKRDNFPDRKYLHTAPS